MGDYHEKVDLLDEQTRDFTRALNSLKEEIEAVDWYNQRVNASHNEELKAIMAHNRDEEMEHAAMTLEWLRRTMPGWDEQLRKYLFTSGSLLEVEEGVEGGDSNESTGLNIGDLK